MSKDEDEEWERAVAADEKWKLDLQASRRWYDLPLGAGLAVVLVIIHLYGWLRYKLRRDGC